MCDAKLTKQTQQKSITSWFLNGMVYQVRERSRHLDWSLQPGSLQWELWRAMCVEQHWARRQMPSHQRSTRPAGSSGAEVRLQRHPMSGHRAQALNPHINQTSDAGCPPILVMTLGKEALQSRTIAVRGHSAASKLPVIMTSLLGKWVFLVGVGGGRGHAWCTTPSTKPKLMRA